MDVNGRQRVPLRLGQRAFDAKRSDRPILKRFRWNPDVIHTRHLLKHAGYQVQEKKTCALSKMAFSGRHYNHKCWLLTQKYNTTLEDYRENTAWVALFHSKDKCSFDQALDENDVVTDKEREGIKKLRDVKYSKLVIDTEPPLLHRFSLKKLDK